MSLLVAVRIIPARAGFTSGVSSGDAAKRDHPRSRGVYMNEIEEITWETGSSPLARGLLHSRSAPTLIPGIIPARAGFTMGVVGSLGGVEDHPRSRGVYTCAWSSTCFFSGSSPLARGLLHERYRDGDERRIIPARAGFTARARAGSRLHRDHPRSRGVYSPPRPMTAGTEGSSPLARGLHSTKLTLALFSRIIPARAGFTRVDGSLWAGQLDHPRSRGVYGDRRRAGVHLPGSSPLARGLPIAPPTSWEEAGIIPARAGFTRPMRSPRTRSGDHPRSRGVYSRTSGIP